MGGESSKARNAAAQGEQARKADAKNLDQVAASGCAAWACPSGAFLRLEAPVILNSRAAFLSRIGDWGSNGKSAKGPHLLWVFDESCAETPPSLRSCTQREGWGQGRSRPLEVPVGGRRT